MTKKIIAFTLALSMWSSAALAQFWVRVPEASPQDYAHFLDQNHYLSYMDWLEASLPKRSAKAEHLDEALNLALNSPSEALPLFDQALHSLQVEIMGPEARNLYIAICKKVSSLDLPKRIRDDFATRATQMIEVQADSKLKPNAIEMKDLQLTLSKVHAQAALADSKILLNGEDVGKVISKSIPTSEQQWVLVSNAYEPLIVVGTWNEFQKQVMGSDWQKPFANGDCDSTRWVSRDLQMQTAGGIFSSANCGKEPAGAVAGSPAGNHLGDLEQTTTQWKPENHWRWIVPAVAVVAAVAAVSLAGKHVVVTWP